ncbi:MAG: hypothetical protein B7X04_01420 [Parcubacteria group bacterium 21-54-25]|nr:MAG: hypothetical protein B7X04_01420 [Parcubacteria group bacterium 21-54-25]HQU07589.1 DNA repair protein RadC [Candidatus Paceibacterota bacterium]
MSEKREVFRRVETDGPCTAIRELTPDEVIGEAKRIIKARFRRGRRIAQPRDAEDYLILTLGDREQEVFSCLYLDQRHRVISCDLMAFGTLAEARVYPREIVKRAILYNASSIIFAHNHPSGVAEPSKDDEALTRRLSDALRLIDVRVLDHFVVGGGETVTFAERGLL